jgi:hypothetical protein
LVRWQASAVSLPPGDVIFAKLTYPLKDIIFFLFTTGITGTYLSTNIEPSYLLIEISSYGDLPYNYLRNNKK